MVNPEEKGIQDSQGLQQDPNDQTYKELIQQVDQIELDFFSFNSTNEMMEI